MWRQTPNCARLTVLALLVVLVGGLFVDASAGPLSNFPPLSPESEIPAHEPAFAARCLAKTEIFPTRRNWQLGMPLVTRSKKWGLLWRVDFEIVGNDVRPLVNRVVCQGTEDGEIVNIQLAVAQSITPLFPSKKPAPNP